MRLWHTNSRMEKQYPGFVLKILRSDRAKEILDSNKMRAWMAENGIVPEMSPPYTPQLNSKPERYWRTLLEPVRSILAMAELPLSLCVMSPLVVIPTKLPAASCTIYVPPNIVKYLKLPNFNP